MKVVSHGLLKGCYPWPTVVSIPMAASSLLHARSVTGICVGVQFAMRLVAPQDRQQERRVWSSY